ncbi:hypothetical protein LVD17_09890 [Fulvivirga ulvae]|uniref:hypothetical protein n=1 Tax=Fulvivirga ulvae TaxID=2904245 RepID=UPI001F1BB29F|nr:hypothetical protein [Fulvivirga ulvae]UII34124.1 hypothetical protein LVD17_09890 [Fulvivirga ulvae]
MKSWNRIGFIKAIFVLVMAALNMMEPVYYNLNGMGMVLQITIGSLVAWMLFGILINYVVIKVTNGSFVSPQWNDNPLNFKKPQIFLQFAGISILIFGFANILGVLIQSASFSFFGLQNISSGMGLLLSLKLSKYLIALRRN